jgi:hypothetical protein
LTDQGPTQDRTQGSSGAGEYGGKLALVNLVNIAWSQTSKVECTPWVPMSLVNLSKRSHVCDLPLSPKMPSAQTDRTVCRTDRPIGRSSVPDTWTLMTKAGVGSLVRPLRNE